MNSEQTELGLGDARIDKFAVILADPPWTNAHSPSSKKAVERPYPTLATDQIAALPVQELAAADSLLFLWATAPLLEHALAVLRSVWGNEVPATWNCPTRGSQGRLSCKPNWTSQEPRSETETRPSAVRDEGLASDRDRVWWTTEPKGAYSVSQTSQRNMVVRQSRQPTGTAGRISVGFRPPSQDSHGVK